MSGRNAFAAAVLLAFAGVLAAAEPSPAELVQAIEAAMVRVEPGAFLMGTSEGDPDSVPLHTVTITRPFRMLRHEVTFEDYDRYCELSNTPRPKDNGWGRGRRPVIFVSYTHAVRFCNFLSELAGLRPCYDAAGATCDFTAGGYRLPTEAEWEFAARGGAKGKGSRFAGSEDPAEVAWFGEEPATHPVETRKPNELGLYDMSGNVWEWCQDLYGSAYYAKSPAQDPRGPGVADADQSYGVKRVRRGGNYHEAARCVTVTFRSRDVPRQADPGMGFRIVRSE